MAAVDVVIAAPPQPVPVPAVRISRTALAAADAVVCLWFVSLWVLPAGIAAVLIRFLACGSGWGCTGAAWMAVLFSVLVLAICLELTEFKETFQYYIELLEKGAAALEPIGEAFVNAHVIAITAFLSFEILGFLLNLAANDPPTARVASVIMILAILGICIMCCLVSIPGLAVRLWRMRRHGGASVVPI